MKNSIAYQGQIPKSQIKRLSRLILKRPRQISRLTRLGANFLAGGTLIRGLYQFPKTSKIHQKQLIDFKSFRLWVDDLSKSMNVDLHIHGEQMKENGLLVSNHVSWLDTIIIIKSQATGFVARDDLARWPLLGKFSQRMGSVFISRDNKFQAYRCIPKIEDRLNEGRCMHIFPEATTSDGSSVLTFYSMFYEAAVRTGKPVQPIVIRYTNDKGERLEDPAYINKDTFFDTLSRIMLVDKVHAHIHFLPPLKSIGKTRKELNCLSRDKIVETLNNYA